MLAGVMCDVCGQREDTGYMYQSLNEFDGIVNLCESCGIKIDGSRMYAIKVNGFRVKHGTMMRIVETINRTYYVAYDYQKFKIEIKDQKEEIGIVSWRYELRQYAQGEEIEIQDDDCFGSKESALLMALGFVRRCVER